MRERERGREGGREGGRERERYMYIYTSIYMYISGTSINSLPLAQGEYFSQQSSKLQWRIEGATAPGHHPKEGRQNPI